MEQIKPSVHREGKHRSDKASLIILAACYAGTVAGIALAEQIAPNFDVKYLKEGFYLLSAFCMILAPAEAAFRAGFDVDLFGLSRRGLGKSLKWALIICALIFPPYILGYCWYATELKGMRFDAVSILPNTPLLLLQHIFLVGLPEEFFYRGFIQRELDRIYPKTWFRFVGVEIGPAFFFASALFALGHLALLPASFRLAVFFPSLMFGWLYKKTGNIGGGMLIHGLSNVLLFNLQNWFYGVY